MAFQIEPIDTPERRAEFDAFKFTYPLSQTPLESRRWVVDRERGLFFVNRGGDAFELPYLLCLVTNEGARINCEGTMDAKGNAYPDGAVIKWIISSVQIPKELAGRSEEILAWLHEALMLYGNLGDPEITKRTSVKLPSPVFV